MAPQLMTIQEVADLLRVSIHTMRYWRQIGEGPPVKKVVGQLRYRRVDVERWLENRVDPRPAA